MNATHFRLYFCLVNFFFISNELFQLAWICAQQRQNLNSLILSRPDTGPSVCCQKANSLENTKFVDAHKAKGIKYQVNILSFIGPVTSVTYFLDINSMSWPTSNYSISFIVHRIYSPRVWLLAIDWAAHPRII